MLRLRDTEGAEPNAPRYGDAIEERVNLVAEMRTILDTAEAEGRDLSAAERGEYDQREARVGELEDAIRTYEREHRYSGHGTFAQRPGPGEWLAAELRAISSGAGLGDALTPEEHAGYFFDRLAARSVALQTGIRVVTTEAGELHVPHVTTDPDGGWTAENDEIVASDASGETIVATPRKLASRTVISNEVVEDSNPEILALYEGLLVRDQALKLDLGIYEGSGTPPEIRGIRETTGIQEIELAANGAAFTNLDPFAEAIGLLEAANATPSAAVMAPRTWQDLLQLKEDTSDSTKPLLQDSAGSGARAVTRAVYGIPVYLTSQLAIDETQGTADDASSVYLYEADQVVLVRRAAVRVSIDRGGEYFDRDQVAVRATSRHDLVVPNPEAVVRIKGVIPAT